MEKEDTPKKQKTFKMPKAFTSRKLLVEIMIQETVRYDNNPNCQLNMEDTDYGKECLVQIKITKRMELPVNVYYELTSFYQSHSSIFYSLSKEQQMGQIENSYPECEAAENLNGKIIYPCGKLPGSVFTDRIIGRIVAGTGTAVEFTPWAEGFDKEHAQMWAKGGISWALDRSRVKNMDTESADFKNQFIREGYEQKRANDLISDESKKIFLPLPENEDLIVWQRVSPWPKFRKIYRKINKLGDSAIGRDHFEPDDVIELKIQNYFRVNSENEQKKIVLSTQSLYGPNVKTSILIMIVITVFCMACAIAAFLNCILCPRRFGDVLKIN